MKLRNLGAVLASLVLACSIFLSGPALAERGHGRGHHGGGERMLQKFATELQLSEAQITQIKQIFESHKGQFQQLREQMKSTFTDEQRAAMKEHRKNRKAGGERPTAEERKARWAALGVSEGQLQQMKALREQMRAERQAMQSEIASVLTPEQQSKLQEMKSRWKGKRGKHRHQQK